MQATNGILWYFFLALLQGYSQFVMKEYVQRFEKIDRCFDYGSSLLVTASISSERCIPVSVKVYVPEVCKLYWQPLKLLRCKVLSAERSVLLNTQINITVDLIALLFHIRKTPLLPISLHK